MPIELMIGAAHHLHRYSEGESDPARFVHYAGRVLREFGNHTLDATVFGLPFRAIGYTAGLGVDTYNLGANVFNYFTGRALPIVPSDRFGMVGSFWNLRGILPSWRSPEVPPGPRVQVFNAADRTKDLLTRNPQELGQWSTWVSDRMFQVSSDLSIAVRRNTNDGQRMAADSANSAYGSWLSKTFRAMRNRERVLVAAHVLKDVPTIDEWKTLLRLRGQPNAQEQAAAYGIDANRWHILQNAIATPPNANDLATEFVTKSGRRYANQAAKQAAIAAVLAAPPTPPALQNLPNQLAGDLANIYLVHGNVPNAAVDTQSVADLTAYRRARGLAAVEYYEAERQRGDANYAVRNAEISRYINEAIENPVKAIKLSDDAEKVQRACIDLLFVVTSENMTNILQRKGEAEEIYYTRKILMDVIWKDIWDYAKYGYVTVNNPYESIWTDTYDKAFSRLCALLQEVDPLASRRQPAPTV